MLTSFDERLLAEAFPSAIRSTALIAGQEIARILDDRHWSEQFGVRVGQEQVLIPARLSFVKDTLTIPKTDEAWLVARALQTRSYDGFERQRAANDLMTNVEEWSAPFIVALIGSYVVEILQDIDTALNSRSERVLGDFIAKNAGFWAITKQQVASYWNVYYRRHGSFNSARGFSRSEYVGFHLIDRLEKVVRQRSNSGHE